MFEKTILRKVHDVVVEALSNSLVRVIQYHFPSHVHLVSKEYIKDVVSEEFKNSVMGKLGLNLD